MIYSDRLGIISSFRLFREEFRQMKSRTEQHGASVWLEQRLLPAFYVGNVVFVVALVVATVAFAVCAQ